MPPAFRIDENETLAVSVAAGALSAISKRQAFARIWSSADACAVKDCAGRLLSCCLNFAEARG